MSVTYYPWQMKDKDGRLLSPNVKTDTITTPEGDPIGGFITQSELAPVYGSKESYAVGEFCSVNNDVYRCVNPVPDSSVAFDPTDWENTNFGDEITSTNEILANIMNLVYPVGSIYMSTDSVNPSTKFGGTWVAWGSGKVPVGVDANDTAFDTVEETGGSKSESYTPAGSNAAVKLTAAQSGVPAHAHGLNSHKHTYDKAKTPTGGTAITVEQMPSHTHIASWYQPGNTGGAKFLYGATNSTLIGTDSSPIGSTGGGKTHTHTISTTSTDTGAASGNTANNTAAAASESHNHTFTGTAATISHLQPYITCYMWKRTA